MKLRDSMMTLFELLPSIPVGITQQSMDKNANIVSTNISYIPQRREPSLKLEIGKNSTKA
ncbi:MAG: hypothetical protein DRH21_01595 [Deltaproteobacteria bacterium]|nr:MAG: hypothetical protein DRH21_01595 [Deltaproteobacteria bacterium]